MPICGDASVVNHGHGEGFLSMLRCKKWDCARCAPHNRMAVMNKARRGQPNLFMTLTCQPGRYATPGEAARDMKRGLVALRRRIERKWGVKNIPFIVVFEATKKGWPHMHLLMRAPFMHWKVLRAMWKEITGAFEVDVRFIKKHTQVLFYVTKYIGKQLGKFEGCKRWWRSHNYETITETPWKAPPLGEGFRRWDDNPLELVRAAEADDWEIEQISKFRWWLRPRKQGPWTCWERELRRAVARVWGQERRKGAAL